MAGGLRWRRVGTKGRARRCAVIVGGLAAHFVAYLLLLRALAVLIPRARPLPTFPSPALPPRAPLSAFTVVHGYRARGDELVEIAEAEPSRCSGHCDGVAGCDAWLHLHGVCVLKGNASLPGA